MLQRYSYLVVWFLAVLFACGGEDMPTGADISNVPRISAQDLKSRLDAGDIILIADTRSEAEYNEEHIAGALSKPYDVVAADPDAFPRDRDIVFY
jgi:3-mercaptopyruvate sulfurtransferase SseA